MTPRLTPSPPLAKSLFPPPLTAHVSHFHHTPLFYFSNFPLLLFVMKENVIFLGKVSEIQLIILSSLGKLLLLEINFVGFCCFAVSLTPGAAPGMF
jgi:hypothetical protein